MRGRLAVLALLLAVGAALPAPASADTINFKLLSRYSFATFKSDAPLETVVGHTADAGVQGTLKVDPDKPSGASGVIRVDMNTVRTGVDKRDADMRSKDYLHTEVEANRWVTFEVRGVEVAGPLTPGKTVPAKVKGVLTIKQKPVEMVADATVTYIKLSPEQVETQKRFGFTTDNLKVRAKFGTTFNNHDLKIPQLLILKLANEILLETDLTFVRAD